MREIGTISRPCPQAPATSRPRASCSPRTRASPRCSRRSGPRSARRPDWPRPSPCSRPPTPPSPRSTTRPWPASSPTLTLSRTVGSPLRIKLGGTALYCNVLTLLTHVTLAVLLRHVVPEMAVRIPAGSSSLTAASGDTVSCDWSTPHNTLSDWSWAGPHRAQPGRHLQRERAGEQQRRRGAGGAAGHGHAGRGGPRHRHRHIAN